MFKLQGRFEALRGKGLGKLEEPNHSKTVTFCHFLSLSVAEGLGKELRF